jgi:hypothetical protein
MSTEKQTTEESTGYWQGRDALAPIPTHVASPVIKPVDKGKLKSVALETVAEQANLQIAMLRKQAALLMEQAREIENRVLVAQEVYAADINFEPVIGQQYHLYARADESRFLSMISPEDWGKKARFTFIATVKLLGDRSWDVIRKAD